jgi:lysozyme family protein
MAPSPESASAAGAALPALSSALHNQLTWLMRSCRIRPERAAEVEATVNRVLVGRARYQRVAAQVHTPWYVIGAIHSLESSCSFSCHLHNGDPLTARTVHVPAGRPATGTPPFTWEVSALDALTKPPVDLQDWHDWSVAGTLYRVEAYNGLGYRQFHPHVLSPYLWGASTHYRRGKYVGDGTFSATAVSSQVGAAVIMRRLAERQLISLGAPPNALAARPPLFLSPDAMLTHGRELQAFLNLFPGIDLDVDGSPGRLTSEAVRSVLGYPLFGDHAP